MQSPSVVNVWSEVRVGLNRRDEESFRNATLELVVCASDARVENVNVDTRAVGGIAVGPIERPLTLVDAIQAPVVVGVGTVDSLLGVHPQDGVGLNPPNPRALSDVRKFCCIEIRNDKIEGTFGLGAQ